MFNKINHVIEGKKKLLHQFKNKKIINILFDSIFNQINDIEDTLYDLYYKRNLKDSVGKQIDTNGILRDLERNGLNDYEFRQNILNKIALDNSEGLIKSVIDSAKIILNDNNIIYKELYPAGIEIFVLNKKCNINQYKYIEKSIPLCVSLVLKFSGSLKPFGYNNKICIGFKSIYDVNKNKGYASNIGDYNND